MTTMTVTVTATATVTATMTRNESWAPAALSATDRVAARPLLRRLADHDLPVVVVRDLLDRRLLERGLQQIRDHDSRRQANHYVNGTLTTIGPYLARHLSRMDEYFATAGTLDEVFADPEFDVRGIVRERLRSLFGLSGFRVEQEPDGRRYADSIVRIHGDGVENPLHNDNIMRDAAGLGLTLERLRHQLSCVICIQECDRGGELINYRKEWSPPDELFKIRDGIGYDQRVVDGVARSVFRPQTGDVYLINPTAYHEIARVGGADRVTLSFFIGFGDDELTSAVVWS
jgi:hypothetical protein